MCNLREISVRRRAKALYVVNHQEPSESDTVRHSIDMLWEWSVTLAMHPLILWAQDAHIGGGEHAQFVPRRLATRKCG